MTEQTSSAAARARSEDLADTPAIEYTREDRRRPSETGQMIDHASRGNSICATEHDCRSLDDRTKELGVLDDIQSVWDERCPSSRIRVRVALGYGRGQGVDFVPTYGFRSKAVADHVVPQKPIGIHEVKFPHANS
ncbi:hypothetical protein E9228_000103 [Curtobacterium flaccumfaciens]|uniref:Uncharacterized protein n=1 Tax=Curtobacterium salicis TaxID=1779862 RepID=A0ABX0T6I9_9MICO|nr:hypothetical protein [Curtobacterium sp. WW7]